MMQVTRSNFCITVSESVETKPLLHSFIHSVSLFLINILWKMTFSETGMLFSGTFKEKKDNNDSSHLEGAFWSPEYFHTQCQIWSPKHPCEVDLTSYYSREIEWLAPPLAANNGRAPCWNPGILTPDSGFTLLLQALQDTVPTVKELTVKFNPLSNSFEQKSKLREHFL